MITRQSLKSLFKTQKHQGHSEVTGCSTEEHWDTSGSIHIRFWVNCWLLCTQKHFTLARIVAFPTFSYPALNGVTTHFRSWSLVCELLSHLLRTLWEARVLFGGLPSQLWLILTNHTEQGHSELSIEHDCVLTAYWIYSLLHFSPCWSDLRLSLWTCLWTPIPPWHASIHSSVLEIFVYLLLCEPCSVLSTGKGMVVKQNTVSPTLVVLTVWYRKTWGKCPKVKPKELWRCILPGS